MTDEAVAKWRQAYDTYAALADGDDLPVTPDLARRIADETGAKWRDVQRWLSQPARYSPYPDDLAIERALEWDWPVIRNLSLLERVLFEGLLAAHPDPYGEAEELAAGVPTPRHMRYMDGPERTRGWLRPRVDEMIEQMEASHG